MICIHSNNHFVKVTFHIDNGSQKLACSNSKTECHFDKNIATEVAAVADYLALPFP